MSTTKDAHAAPVRLSAGEKAAVTDQTARHIISSENALRVSKTSRLRQLRLEKEAMANPAPAVRAKKK
ncbi:hypothetical protein [Rhizobium sp. SL86]|uniref:hypothetical protein n=1 Tax=Rhizobium sp. SL86 TaxID=2995148 RepID=UPI002274923A|nr:hypothetical protein [Rhizobium sp. SL86]MCY1666890.1 hypothetical protein [Rhizobium sp. SL86]